MTKRLFQYGTIGLCIVFLFGFAPSIVHADLATEINKQSAAVVGVDPDAPNLGQKDPRAIAALLIASLLSVLGTLMIVYFVYGGYLIFSSAGDEDKIKKGRTIIVNAIIGLAIILSAYSIAKLVDRFFRLTVPYDTPCYIEEPAPKIVGAPNPKPKPAWLSKVLLNEAGVDCYVEGIDGDGGIQIDDLID